MSSRRESNPGHPWLEPPVFHATSSISEEVRRGDVTTGVKRAWNIITVDKYSFFQAFYFQFSFKFCTSAGPVDALKVQK